MAKKGMNIYKRKDGRWEGRFAVTGEKTNKKKYRSIYGKTYSEVREKLLNLQKLEKPNTKKCGLTVKEIFNLWLNDISCKVKPSTYANYLQKLENHILPELGGLKYENLTTGLINGYIAKKIKYGRISDSGKLSEKYVRDIVALLKSLGKFAHKTYGYNDVVSDTICPRAEQKELKLISKAEQQKLINSLFDDTDNTKLGIILSYYTGIRLGELCALKWSDIDVSENVICINKTIQRVKKFSGNAEKLTEVSVSSPKSRKSNREIPIPAFLLPEILRLKKADNCYILSGTHKPVEPRLMQYRFKAFLRKENLPSMNFHALRHLFATNCLQSGFDIKTLSEILGHSTVEITLNRYVHSSRERKRECMEMLKLAI